MVVTAQKSPDFLTQHWQSYKFKQSPEKRWRASKIGEEGLEVMKNIFHPPRISCFFPKFEERGNFSEISTKIN